MPTGYVTDTPYADTFFRELSPAWLNYVAALNGVTPRQLDAPFSYLELGCGFGTSAVVNAAAFPHAAFHAYDLNDAHIQAGQAYAASLGVDNINLGAASFDALLTRDLPSFDFIVLHGVYSWVDGQTREVLRRLIARLLRPGALVYVSYNALPGWSHELPLRKLLVELAASGQGNAGERSESAAAMMKTLSAAGLRYFGANPGAQTAVDAYTRGEGHYLAHEFMNAAWEPFYGVDVADDFATIGLQPVGSATLAHNHLPLIVDAKSAEAIAELPTLRQQALAVDFATNLRFRRDVFVHPDGSTRHEHYLHAIPIGCPTRVDEIPSTVRVPRGDVRFQEPFVRDVRALMDDGSRSVGELVAALSGRGLDQAGIARNILFLVAGGALAPFARAFIRNSSTPTRLANPVVERALADVMATGGRRAIPSAVYGNGIEVDVSDARALMAWSSGEAADAGVAQWLPTFARLGLVV